MGLLTRCERKSSSSFANFRSRNNSINSAYLYILGRTNDRKSLFNILALATRSKRTHTFSHKFASQQYGRGGGCSASEQNLNTFTVFPAHKSYPLVGCCDLFSPLNGGRLRPHTPFYSWTHLNLSHHDYTWSIYWYFTFCPAQTPRSFDKISLAVFFPFSQPLIFSKPEFLT